ncbi:tRNA (adenosine(37)-N6)-threonylcarbamoyltransferase complex ATPase subunit type 1 TsaE [Marinobacterium rhizophilum]|uniref:tRNA threonylcarbamoyladenosine biosynthesis protein TsaE n=1 Tax=Marinobacterium rhizophilum TaxID=420402 RepID=A0ABY5HIU6_9GAMM|nr:tRNA (adenosine(37)-N6)-threonylcarbamoyltransferase complex ATPase subunit type 1 TsaE [Marinobacterium rhizophilum]UTW11771.1 tRNA (adenosine(37)-N6)-threonylcarbamoyltransferase complex ATPase subunit type 1 TsaE [Marinobacterium rhizophilum]
MTERFVYGARDEDVMVAFGEALGRACGGRGIIFLHGDLGMGKTTLCRGVLRAYGHLGSVKSPTYTLVEPYDLEGRRLYHFDLYRLADPEELEYLGIRDYFEDDDLCLIEWPQRGAGWLPRPDLDVEISIAGQGRSIECQGRTARGQQILTALLQEGTSKKP